MLVVKSLQILYVKYNVYAAFNATLEILQWLFLPVGQPVAGNSYADSNQVVSSHQNC